MIRRIHGIRTSNFLPQLLLATATEDSVQTLGDSVVIGEAVLARGGTSDFHKILQNLIIRRSRQAMCMSKN